jgi:hypothetical protein
MQQMSAATGIPMAALRHASKNGCLFMRHSRCHLAEFIAWWWTEDNDEKGEEGVVWKERGERAKALREEIRLEEDRENVIEWNAVSRFIRHLTGVLFFGELDRFQLEFPAKLRGKDEVGIYAECLAQVRKAKEAILNQVDIWMDNKGKEK